MSDEKIEWDEDGRGHAPGHPGCFAYKLDGNVVTWTHTTHGPSTDDLMAGWQALSTSARLRETQAALAASQQDLTRVEAERDALALLNAELKAEAANWREIAERYLGALDETGRELAAVRDQNRRLTAENEIAVRLNEANPMEGSK